MTPLLTTLIIFFFLGRGVSVRLLYCFFFYEAFPRHLSSSQTMSLETLVSDDKILKVLFSFKDNKAPGLDGFHMGFF